MQSVLGEISKLRNGSPIIIDYRNSNRYRLVVQENNGTKTGYYFSTPIYNRDERKMIDLRFRKSENTVYAVGSNAHITLGNIIRMDNAEGSCSIDLEKTISEIAEKRICYGNVIIEPTTNGVAMKFPVNGLGKHSFIIEVNEPFLELRANDKYFALMKERFRPLVVFSCIGSLDTLGNVIAPARVEYQKISDKKYLLQISSCSPMAGFVMVEGNLYENKLFQDTTVESANSSVNNAFGSVGFIGNTAVYGEQWLYSRPDYSRMNEIMDKSIKKLILHMPKLNPGNVEIRAFNVKARFCSFGSNWDNKIPEGNPVSDSRIIGRYQSIDLTPLFVNSLTKGIVQTEGFILKPVIKNNGFSAVATGDSYLAPQILEINYK